MSDGDEHQGRRDRPYGGPDWTPIPDPTKLTTEQLRATEGVLNQNIAAAVAGLRELLETRLSGMDRATDLLSERMSELGVTLDSKSYERERNLQALVEQRLTAIHEFATLLAAQMEKITVAAAAARDRVRDEFAAADQALRELLGARVDGMDQATKLLAVTMDKVPSDIDRAVSSLRQILEGQTELVQTQTLEKFNAVDALFASNATALTAALAAQEKAVAEQNKSNTLAIDKSEQATKETIAANVNQTSTGLAGLGVVMDDLKARLVRLESQAQQARVASEDSLAVNTYGQTAQQNHAAAGRANVQLAIAGLSAFVAIIAVLFAVLHKLRPGAACA